MQSDERQVHQPVSTVLLQYAHHLDWSRSRHPRVSRASINGCHRVIGHCVDDEGYWRWMNCPSEHNARAKCMSETHEQILWAWCMSIMHRPPWGVHNTDNTSDTQWGTCNSHAPQSTSFKYTSEYKNIHHRELQFGNNTLYSREPHVTSTPTEYQRQNEYLITNTWFLSDLRETLTQTRRTGGGREII